MLSSSWGLIHKHFSIRPVYTAIMVLGVSLCLWAAQWQYFKAQSYQEPSVERIELNGQFINSETHFLDNQTLNGNVGYAVITPFSSDQGTYLVNRGFVHAANRDSLPDVDFIQGRHLISGRLKPATDPMVLSQSTPDKFTNRIQTIDLEYFSERLSGSLKPSILVLESDAGLLQPFSPKDAYLSHHRHLAYALQWGLLAMAGVIIWLVASYKKKK